MYSAELLAVLTVSVLVIAPVMALLLWGAVQDGKIQRAYMLRSTGLM